MFIKCLVLNYKMFLENHTECFSNMITKAKRLTHMKFFSSVHR